MVQPPTQNQFANEFGQSVTETVSVPRAEEEGLTKWHLSPEDVIEELEHDLKREYLDIKEEKWKKRKIKIIKDGKTVEIEIPPLLNELGLRSLISIIRARINKITFLSNLAEDDILLISKTVHIDVASLLYNTWHKYEIEKENLTIIVNMVSDIVYTGLLRAKDGMTANIQQTQTKVREVTGLPQQKGKGKLWGILGSGN